MDTNIIIGIMNLDTDIFLPVGPGWSQKNEQMIRLLGEGGGHEILYMHSKKLYSDLLYEMGQDYLDRQ